ncbi:MAG: heme-binding protein [Bdellovibrionales bacterium]|nr:heme-binding protein [Bdellovibrionales bacterium]
MSIVKFFVVVFVLLITFAGCGDSGSSDVVSRGFGGSDSANFGCDGTCPNEVLTSGEVERILRQAVAGAKILGVAATFAVLDRVGNVLAVYQMPGANATTTINGKIGAVGGLEGVTVPATLAAISKAGTGAYLSSQGNGFTSRTASQIVQENFNPGEMNQPGGPLFGVQFSQLICSDITVLNPLFTAGISTGSNLLSTGGRGPRPLPLGLSADPGGIPLYKLGDMVGGLGVELDGQYSLDREVFDFDDNIEERLALIASRGFEAPSERAGDSIFVVGKSFRYTDLSYDQVEVAEEPLPELNPAALTAVTLFTDGTIRSGTRFGDPASGITKTSRAGVPAAVLTDEAGNPRFPPRSGTPLAGGIELSAVEVDALLDSILFTSFRTRAQIRNPKNSPAQVSIFVVDTQGVVLGMVRSGDAPLFGIDVALQKARTAVFFSSTDAGDRLNEVRSRNGVGAFDDYVSLVRAFLGPDALTGTNAFSDRAGGNMSRPFFPDGINGRANGPFSHPFPGTSVAARTWSPFNTGLQLDLVFQRLVQPLGVPVNPPSSLPDSCTDSGVLGTRLRNGIQIFPGSVPVYRGKTLIGGIGISGDGVDQDDLIAFYGASRPGLDAIGRTGIGDPILGFNAPPEIRADNLQGPIENTRLRFVNCPESPFRDSSEQQVCGGL